MKLSLYGFMLITLVACSKPSETTEVTQDSLAIEEPEFEEVADEPVDQASQDLRKLMEDFEVAKDNYPSISFTQQNERTTRIVQYFFEDDNLIWMKGEESANEGGNVETYMINRDPEGTFYIHYGTKIDGTYGYAGMDGGTWYSVTSNEDYLPEITGDAKDGKFDWETEFEETMGVVRSNKSDFTLRDGVYAFDHMNFNKTYKFSEVLFNANLLAANRFNPDIIKGYLDWWYPLYEVDGKLTRKQLCSGDEDYIKIAVEAGNYRWEEQAVGTTLVYLIKGFEEGEGDAFVATVEMSGNRFRKTLVKPEFEDGASDKLYIDGQAYTNDPSKYSIVKNKCN